IVLEPGLIQAAIWTINEEKAQVLSISNPVSWLEDEDLINACDASLSSAIQNFPNDIGEPSKTVFGVSSKWVENGEIKEEYIGKIKKICSELSLEPSGFVILPEAIAHLLKSEEGSPLSAIVIAAREENIEISLFKIGNLIGTTIVARSVSIPDDVIEGLTRFGLNDSYPSRFLVYDGKEGELEEIKQNLLSYDWESGEKIKFLHTPKIEIISPERKITATALAGASEISNIKTIETLKKDDEEIPSDTENVSVPDGSIKPEDLGFVIGEDIGKDREIISKEEESNDSQQLKNEIHKPIEKKNSITETAQKALLGVKDIFNKTSKQKIQFNGSKKNLLLGGIIFAITLITGFLLWWLLPKAVVTIYVSPKKLEDKIELTLDTSGGSSNISEGILSGKVIEVNEEGEKTKSTTGTKTIGERAKGTVKIQNGTSNSIRLSEGAILLSSGDLQFTLDSSASVSAAISPSLPGETNVDVTAGSIGADYNLAKDEVFKVSNYPKSDVDAIVLSDFSGGSSRQISAVSEDNQKDLLEELKNELLESAKVNIKNKLGEELYFIEDSLIATDLSRVFSNKVGDEALNLKLDLSINSKGVAVNEKDFFDFINSSLNDQIPSGYVLRSDQVKVRFDLKDVDEKNYFFDIFVEVNLLPQIEIDEIREKIKGKSKNVVEKYLETVPGFSRAEIKFIPILPGKLNTLPHVSKNISVDLATER
ncbi:MAG: hypothetical protein ABIJ05_00835, partial [Patescibacteria group bacterium]